MASPQYAFVTLVTTDSYLPGALVVAATLRDLHPSPANTDEVDPSDFHIICLVTPETVNVQTLKLLRRAFDVVIGVEVIQEDTDEALALLGRPDLKTVLTKLHIFRLKAYNKIVYLDADVLPLLPLSHLFRTTSSFSAAPDVGWPDIFNSGVLVFTPGDDKFNEIMEIVVSQGSWDGGDQGVLNEWRGKEWERLSFTYNTTPTAAYTYAPAYKRFGSDIKAIHFIGRNKPWLHLPYRVAGSSHISNTTDDYESSYAYSALLDRWFSVYDKHYRSTVPIFSSTGELLPTAAFQETMYENAWDDRRHYLIAGATGGRLGLHSLRQLALEGLGQTPTRQEGEGAYMTLPLNGRIDLMSRSRAQMRDLYARKSWEEPMYPPSSSKASSSDSPEIKTPDDTLAAQFSRVSISSEAQINQAPWDPWSGAYTNTWDLVPGIHRIASHQFRGKQNTAGAKDGDGKYLNEEGSVYRSWEDRIESTSRDGDDEAEDEDIESIR